MRPHGVALAFAWIAIVLAVARCGDTEPLRPLELADGRTIPVETLERGRASYQRQCRACHGDKGDGRGPASSGLDPPPRDFTNPTFAFGGVPAGELPPDPELHRIVARGLAGTAMPASRQSASEIDDVLQFVKTFSDVWKSRSPAAAIPIGRDPWEGNEARAIAEGDALYHGVARCTECHPSYAHARLQPARREVREQRAPPPDFRRKRMKAGNTPRDLFRTIAAGVGGSAMPTWWGALADDEIWAIAHFVRSLGEGGNDTRSSERR